MSNKPKIAVLIPCYNCGEHIKFVIDSITDKSLERISSFIVVDNGSTDNTVNNAVASINQKNTDKIKVLLNDENYGLGGTHKVGFNYAKENNCDFLVVLHGDGQANPNELDNFLRIIDENPEIDAVLGSRFMDLTLIKNYSRLRTFGNVMLNCFASILSFKKVRDFGAGLNIFNIKSVCSLPLETFSDVCDFNIYLLFALLDNNMSIIHVPISWSESGQISNVTTFGIGCDTLRVILSWRFLGSWRGVYKKGPQTVFKPRPFKILDH